MANLSYRSPKTEARDSPIHGKGLFAKEAIAAGEIVAVKGGYILTRQEWASLEPQLGSAEIQVSEELFIAPVRHDQRDGCMLYTNHCCDPNIALEGQIVFVTTRDIPPGEELTHDWATTDDLDYVIKCRCGSPDCRGTVTGQDWMKEELQKKYQGRFCWFIQRKIDTMSSNKVVQQGAPAEKGVKSI
ncbi:MAG: SET domain-containing protein-lysine N-methyltransferase [Halioglobus sp.]|nr:SET domain-containing protein-lysine N-methyltransferase [Halioglobus sp.]